MLPLAETNTLSSPLSCYLVAKKLLPKINKVIHVSNPLYLANYYI